MGVRIREEKDARVKRTAPPVGKIHSRGRYLQRSAVGRAHDGGACAQLTYEEARTQRQIQDRSMRLRTAESFLANLDPSKPFYLPLDWIKALASRLFISRKWRESRQAQTGASMSSCSPLRALPEQSGT